MGFCIFTAKKRFPKQLPPISPKPGTWRILHHSTEVLKVGTLNCVFLAKSLLSGFDPKSIFGGVKNGWKRAPFFPQIFGPKIEVWESPKGRNPAFQARFPFLSSLLEPVMGTKNGRKPASFCPQIFGPKINAWKPQCINKGATSTEMFSVGVGGMGRRSRLGVVVLGRSRRCRSPFGHRPFREVV